MNCPRCAKAMTELEKHGVMIDLCGECGGIWLDKGELAKVLGHMREAERSLDSELNAARTAPAAGRQEGGAPGSYPREHGYEHDNRRVHENHGSYKDEHHGEHGYERDDRHHEGHGYEYDHHYGKRKKTGLQKLFDIFD